MSSSQLELAREPLKTAIRLNSEETGTLALLAEVDLALGDLKAADQQFAQVCQANPRAANAWFLRGYIAWKERNAVQTAAMLDTARKARDRDWKPAASVAEGDVQHRMYSESGFLNTFEHQGDGSAVKVTTARPSPISSALNPIRWAIGTSFAFARSLKSGRDEVPGNHHRFSALRFARPARTLVSRYSSR